MTISLNVFRQCLKEKELDKDQPVSLKAMLFFCIFFLSIEGQFPVPEANQCTKQILADQLIASALGFSKQFICSPLKIRDILLIFLTISESDQLCSE